MKRFIDNNATFEIKVPVTWKYSLKNNKVHTFQEYEIWKSDAFQIIIIYLDTQKEKDKYDQLIKSSDVEIEKVGNTDFYRFPDDTDGNDFTIKTWVKQYSDKIVVFTLSHPNNPDKDLDNRTIEEKVKIIHSILPEFKFIEHDKKQSTINSYRFDMFLQGVGATALILNKAIQNKAFIEATCILANQIDALLRIGIVLKSQLNNCNNEIELEWIYQGPTDKKKSEKDIYKKAFDLGILSQSAFDDLFSLYEDRNRVIHRFIISEITLAEVEEIAYKYYQKQQSINKTIYDIESEQIRLNIGMTKQGNEKQDETKHLEYIKGKIGKLDYFDDKI